MLQNVIYKLLAIKYFSGWLSSDSALFQHCSALKMSLSDYCYNIYYTKYSLWITFLADSAVTQQCWVLKIYINKYKFCKIKNHEIYHRSQFFEPKVEILTVGFPALGVNYSTLGNLLYDTICITYFSRKYVVRCFHEDISMLRGHSLAFKLSIS